VLIPTIGGANTVALFSAVFASIASTASSNCTVELFLAYDHPGDEWYRKPDHRGSVESTFARAIGRNSHFIKMRWVRNQGDRTFTSAVNAAAWDAYRAGFQYLYQIGDDVFFTSDAQNWDIEFARQVNLFGGFGLSGGREQTVRGHSWQERAFVGRKHMCAFGTFFPPELPNYWTDNWVTSLYQTLGRYRANPGFVINNLMLTRYAIPQGGLHVWKPLASKYTKSAATPFLCSKSARGHCRTEPP
jgi:hypothetical protein